MGNELAELFVNVASDMFTSGEEQNSALILLTTSDPYFATCHERSLFKY